MKRNRRKKSNGGAPENVTKALRRRSRVKRQTADGRGKTAPRRAAETVTLEGVFAATERGFGFVTVTEESPLTEDIFIPARKRGGAMAGDRVTVAVRKRDLRPTAGGDFRIEGEITGILSRGFNELCGTLVETEGAERRFAPYRVIPDNLRLADAVEIASAADAAPGDKVLVRITDYGDNRRPPRGEILRSLGASLSLGANYESVLLAAGIRTEFPDEVLRDAERAAAEFHGTGRRFEIKGECNGAPVVDDYAHHPTELAATMATAKKMGYKRIIAVHQPFTYSRTKALMDDFAAVLRQADQCVLLPIMGSREVDDGSVKSEDLAAKIPGSIVVDGLESAANWVKQNAREGDLVVCMSCGDLYKACDMMVGKA